MKIDIINQVDKKSKDSNETTKECILRCAFEAYAEAGFTRVSLADIAKRAGISKPGIFRHFAGKQALQDAMMSRFSDEFCKILLPIQMLQKSRDNSAIQNAVRDLFEWFANNREYFLFFVINVSYPRSSIVLINETVARGITMFLESCVSEESLPEYIKKMQVKNQSVFLKLVYLVATAICFLFGRLMEMDKDKNCSTQIPAETFARSFTQFLCDGWKEIKPISAERLTELDALCEIPQEYFPAKNRIFEALAKVVTEHGFPGVTVERIAGELGMAKSSLYGYFRNKDELIKKLFGNEFQLMNDAIHTTCTQAKNLSEYVYIQMRVQTAYLIKRPSIIPVCGWLGIRGSLPENILKEQENRPKTDFYLHAVLPNVGFPINERILEGWISSLSSSLLLWGQYHDFSDTQIIETIKEYHGFIGSGLNSVFIQQELGTSSVSNYNIM